MLDFTSTLFLDSVTGIIKRPSGAPALNVWVFLKVFQREAWLFIFSMSTALALFICWAESVLGQKEYAVKVNGFVLVFHLLLQLGYPYHFHSTGSRMLFITVAGFTVVAFSYYIADLTSSMTIKSRTEQIKSFGDIVNSPYVVKVFENSAPLNALESAEEGTTFHSLYNAKLQNREATKQPKTYKAAKSMLQVWNLSLNF